MAQSLPSISLQDWHQTGDTFLFQAHRIFYRESGQGNPVPLLVIHGFPTCGWDWAWIEPRLKVFFHLIVPDLCDYGASRNTKSERTSIMTQADMLEALLAAKGLTEVDVLAHDVGDTVAQELLARAKAGVLTFKIKSIIFLNGGMLPDHHRPRPVQKALAGPFGPLIAFLMTKKKMIAGLSDVFGKDTRPDGLLGDALFEASVGVNGKSAFARRIHYMAERRENADRWRDALVQPDLPMMLINGVDDPVSGGHAADAFEKLVTHATVKRLEGIGHFPQIEAPEKVANLILDFHERLKG